MSSIKYLLYVFFAMLLLWTCKTSRSELENNPNNLLVLEAKNIHEIDKLFIQFEKTVNRPVDLIFPSGYFRNVNFTKVVSNNSKYRKRILAKQSGKTTIEGRLFLRISGENISIEGLNFIRTKPYGSASGVVVFDNSKKCTIKECSFKEKESLIQTYPNAFSYYVVFKEGSKNKVLRCRFTEKVSEGGIIVAHYLSKDTINGNHHVIDGNYFGLRQYTGRPSDFAIRIGASGRWDAETAHIPAKFVIQNNEFYAYNAYYEIISVKCSDNSFINNTFNECNGYLSLRNTTNNIIEGNKFFGNKKLGTRGVRIQGSGHKVVNNYFSNLSEFAIWIWGGTKKMNKNPSEKNPMPNYINTFDISIENNSIINCQVAIEYFFSGKIKNLNIPKNIQINKNLIVPDSLSKKIFSLRMEECTPNIQEIKQNISSNQNTIVVVKKEVSDIKIFKNKKNKFILSKKMKKTKKENIVYLKSNSNIGYSVQKKKKN